MNPLLEIFSQGEEIVTGQTVDTNAAWLAQEAIHCGFTVTRHTAVGDKLTDLINLLNDISTRADCCICTGGLGPTSDDLTAQAVAAAFNRPLEFDAVAFETIKTFFERRNRVMPEVNRKQALLPQTSKRIDNTWGTAPGFSIKHQRCWFVFLPGVPSEMKPLFLEQVKPDLLSGFTLQPPHLVSLKTLGLGESAIQERIKAIEIPPEVDLGFRAGTEDVQTKLLFPFGYPQAEMAALVAKFSECLGDYVFAIDGLGADTDDLAFEVNRLMTLKNHTLAVLETASHGLLAAKCVGYDWLIQASYERGLVECSQGLNPEALVELGKALAKDVQAKTGVTAVLVQLYSGLEVSNGEQKNLTSKAYSGDSEQKIINSASPLNGREQKAIIGTQEALKEKDQSIRVQSILLVDNSFYESSHDIIGTLKRKQNQAALISLDLLRRYLQGKLI